MEKFSMFDLIGKLLGDEKGQNLVKTSLKNLFMNNTTKPKQEKQEENIKINKPNKFSKIAIQQLYKRHEEISKQIDKTLNNPTK